MSTHEKAEALAREIADQFSEFFADRKDLSQLDPPRTILQRICREVLTAQAEPDMDTTLYGEMTYASERAEPEPQGELPEGPIKEAITKLVAAAALSPVDHAYPHENRIGDAKVVVATLCEHAERGRLLRDVRKHWLLHDGSGRLGASTPDCVVAVGKHLEETEGRP